jgi:hypothetical protein
MGGALDHAAARGERPPLASPGFAA